MRRSDPKIVDMFYIYIMTNYYDSVFYVGMTNNLERRVREHKGGTIPGFTKKYNIRKLVYFEECPGAKSAIAREKQLKNWHRSWKINLIKTNNPDFDDLFQSNGILK